MKFTVKTLDSGSQEFELPDEAKVGGLKQQILEKMGIALEQQRLIFQGKVLKDDVELEKYGVEGKVIHLVKRPPPSVAAPGASEGQGSTPGSAEGGLEGGGGEGEDRNVTVQASQDVVFVGNIPMSSHTDITQVTQNIVDQIVNSLSSQGAQAQVSAEAITTDSTGATFSTTVSAKSGPGPSDSESADPRPTSQAPETAPTPATSSQPEASNATPTPMPAPKEAPRATPTGTRRLVEEAEEREAELRRKEGERSKRELQAIFKHACTVRRCLKFGTMILDRFGRATARAAARRRKNEGEDGGSKDGGEGENWGAVESMEVLEGSGTSDDTMEGKFSELDQYSAENPSALSAQLYVKFLDEMAKLQSRVEPVVAEHRRNAQQDIAKSGADAMHATRVALTVKDFNYYIGHAQVSLSRLNINMLSKPPRTLRLTAQRRTEVRRMMHQFRGGAPPRGEAPSGYIVDISKDDETGGEASTRAIVNRDNGARGVGEAPAARPSPFGGGFPGLGGLFPPGLGLASFLADRREKREAEEKKSSEEKKAAEEKATRGEGSGEGVAKPAEQRDEPMEVEGSVGTEATEHEGKGGVGDDEEVRSKLTPAVGNEGAKEGAKEGEATEGKEEGEEKKEEEGEGDGDDETPQYLARLLSELITGVADPAGPHRPNKPKEGGAEGKTEPQGEGDKEPEVTGDAASAGEGKPGGEGKPDGEGKPGGEAEGKGKAAEEGGERPRTFAERYAGPEGTTVTISAAPAPPFGIPGLPPMEGPSLSIKNPGDGAEPEMTINFPMPPAIQLLQSLLERAEERHRQRREAGETSSEDSDDEEDEEGGAAERRKKAAKKPDAASKPEKAFLDEDGEVKSISDAGSLDDIDSDHEMPAEFENPMTQMAASAMSSLRSGQHVSMLDTMAEVRSHLGAPSGADDDEDDEEDLGMVENILKVVSRELSAVEVMQVFKGHVTPVARLQPGLFNFVREKLLDGILPGKGRRDEAVEAFLANVIPSLRPVEDTFSLRDHNIDFAATVKKTLESVIEEAYDHIITEYTEKEKRDHMFASMMHQWGIHGSALFSNVIRQCVDNEELFDETVNKLIGTLFPPGTPSVILNMCGDSILKELQRARRLFPYTPWELDHYICWKPGTIPTPNDTYPLSSYAVERSTTHPGQLLPLPVRESCPGGGGADDRGLDGDGQEFPPGVPEEWMSAISKDCAANSNRRGPQQPFSEAYLAGMPAKRRKQLDTSEPRTIRPQDLALQLMEEVLIESGIEPKGMTPLELLSKFHHNYDISCGVTHDVKGLVKDRLMASSDFDKEKHPHCMDYYQMHPKERI